MPGLAQTRWDCRCHGTLSDYVTAIAWSPQGTTLAIATAAGDICLVNPTTQAEQVLQGATDQSIDGLAFSHDGRYLAAAGQAGQVLIWSPPFTATPRTLSYARTWIETLAWSPTRPELAFSLGRYAQIWDAATATPLATLPFVNSSILGLAWHPQGEHLALSGHQGVKLWSRHDWDADPQVREMAAASVAIALSADGDYLASGNLDHTLLVWRLNHSDPWQMWGFPGKVRHLAWSDCRQGAAPLLAAASGSDVVVWRYVPQPRPDWSPHVLDLHEQRVTAIAFQPGSTHLATAAADGWVCLWHQAQQVTQILEGAPQGFATLAWSPNGQWLAAGGQQGEWRVWRQQQRGRGFG